jgi:hypothetical protein
MSGLRTAPIDADFLTPQAFQRLRSHPQFRQVVEDCCRANLKHYAGLDLMGRWLISDLGRQSLSRAMLILESILGDVSARTLVEAARHNRTCSRGRALAYLARGELNGMFSAVNPDAPAIDRVYRLEPRFTDVMTTTTRMMLQATARLAPEVAPAVTAIGDESFRRTLTAALGHLSIERHDLFAGPEMPVVLFLYRDGGERMLEHLIVSQEPGRSRLLESAAVSLSSLARRAFTSRQHAMRMLEAGAADGYLTVTPRRVLVSEALSDDVERHFALIFEISRTVAMQALTQDAGAPR